MKVYSTNYFNTFIKSAADFEGDRPVVPIVREKTTIAQLQYDLLTKNPYQYTSDELLFKIHMQRKEIPLEQEDQARADFFSKGQACLRASPLTKIHGFGIHANNEGKIALYGIDTEIYQKMLIDSTIKLVPAMKSKK